jgi:hypothetical protein
MFDADWTTLIARCEFLEEMYVVGGSGLNVGLTVPHCACSASMQHLACCIALHLVCAFKPCMHAFICYVCGTSKLVGSHRSAPMA